MYMANASTNVREPNATSVPLAHVGSMGVRVWSVRVCVGSARLFGNQYVGISNAKRSRWGSTPIRQPNASGFALQWNIGYRVTTCIAEDRVCIHTTVIVDKDDI